MKQIQLTQGKVALVDNENYEFLNSFKWCAHNDTNTFYVVRSKTINGKQKTIRMHRAIMNPADEMEIDHIDHNGLNNQKANLRVVTRQQNLMNRQPNKKTSSQFKGVSWHTQNKLWQAHIKYNQRDIYLGCFENEIDACIIYNQKAIELFGQYAFLNPIPDKYKNRVPVRQEQRIKAKIQSRFKGVSWHKNTQKWLARIWKNKKRYYLGRFDNEENAHQAYLKAKQIEDKPQPQPKQSEPEQEQKESKNK